MQTANATAGMRSGSHGWPLYGGRSGDAPGVVWQWRLRAGSAETNPGTSMLAVACRRTPKMARLEAVLLVADVPLSPRRLAQLATLADATEARTLMTRLNV